jgi:CBS domain containing-hemolysin-like protein
MLINLLIFLLFAFASFLFAGYETGFISWNSFKLKQNSESFIRENLAQRLVLNSEKVISTVLIGNNISLVGMSISFSALIISLFGKELPSFIESATLTIFALLFCELFPKSLFRIYSFRLTLFFTPIIYIFYLFFYPISSLFSIITKKRKVNGVDRNRKFKILNEITKEAERRKLINPNMSFWQDQILKLETLSLGELVASVDSIKDSDIAFFKKSITPFKKYAINKSTKTVEVNDNEEGLFLSKKSDSSSEFIIEAKLLSKPVIIEVEKKESFKYYLLDEIVLSYFILGKNNNKFIY